MDDLSSDKAAVSSILFKFMSLNLAMTGNPSVLIIRVGAFGTSTACHLAHRGYATVTALDRFAAPSKDAAATISNKMVRFDYPNPLYSKLGLEVMKIWEALGNLFSRLLRRTGWIMGAHSRAVSFLKSAYETSESSSGWCEVHRCG